MLIQLQALLLMREDQACLRVLNLLQKMCQCARSNMPENQKDKLKEQISEDRLSPGGKDMLSLLMNVLSVTQEQLSGESGWPYRDPCIARVIEFIQEKTVMNKPLTDEEEELVKMKTANPKDPSLASEPTRDSVVA